LQADFLTSLATDIDLGYIVLPERYNNMLALPTEYIDGVTELLYALLEKRDEIKNA
jgi:hypothetical protein